MMGIKQQLKTGAEYDVVYARKTYCYLQNHPSIVKSVKRSMAKCRRKESKTNLLNYGVLQCED